MRNGSNENARDGFLGWPRIVQQTMNAWRKGGGGSGPPTGSHGKLVSAFTAGKHRGEAARGWFETWPI